MYNNRRYAYLHIAAIDRTERCKAEFQAHPNLKTLRKYREAKHREDVLGSISAIKYLSVKK